MSGEPRRRPSLLGVDEAVARVLASTVPLAPETVALDAAAGRILAEPVRASADMPPFDRTAMDGYALRASDTAAPPANLEVVEEIPAGHDPLRSVGGGEASRIMTGARIPPGADAVVMVEMSESLDGGRRVRILEAASPGQHIRRAGEDLPRGGLLLEAGTWIGAPESALLAGEGRLSVRCGRRPTVALLSTGDELVPAGGGEVSGSRIRETNSWSLRALLRRIGIEPALLGIARDDRADLAVRIAEGLRSDVFLLTGGVSMGEYDLVAGALGEAGVGAIFERVAIQPGKPLFFGVSGARRAGNAEAPATLVFGLPGNPVSAVVDFLVFARPALLHLMGAARPVEPLPAAALDAPLRRKPGRRAYLPARVSAPPGGPLALRILPSMGSADLVALARANALAVVPETASELAAGSLLGFLPLDDAPFR